MKLSVRNQIEGTVIALAKGAVNSEVVISIGQDTNITAIITNSACDNLQLEVGKSAYALIKASNVMVCTGTSNVSARNILSGVVTEIIEGAVNSEVTLSLGEEKTASITAVITKESTDNLALTKGAEAKAIVKASAVLVGVN